MKFQIVEFNEPRSNLKHFCVRLGTRVWVKWFWFKTVWEWATEQGDESATKYNTFQEAQKAVEEIKKQLPIYYNVK